MYKLEGTYHCAGFLLAPADGFGLRPSLGKAVSEVWPRPFYALQAIYLMFKVGNVYLVVSTAAAAGE